MRERPMIFNAEMVRAILDSRKTQTRRIMKVQPENAELGLRRITDSSVDKEVGMYFWCLSDACGVKHRSKLFSCPFGEVGDRIWVRETWARYNIDQDSHDMAYRATTPEDWPEEGRWRPSIHMPRWASRIMLEITGVRVERLASISTGDAQAEGYPAERAENGGQLDAWLWFRDLWDGIYPEQTFKHNPWVWVIEFKRIEGGA